DAAAGDVGRFAVDLGDDVRRVAGGDGQRDLVGVVGVVDDGQVEVDAGGVLDGLEDALSLPGLLHRVDGVVVDHHGLSEGLVRPEVLAVLIVQMSVRSGRLGGRRRVAAFAGRGRL